MCFYSGRESKRELSLEEYEKISRTIRAMAILGISGGEPFMRADLSDIVKMNLNFVGNLLKRHGFWLLQEITVIQK